MSNVEWCQACGATIYSGTEKCPDCHCLQKNWKEGISLKTGKPFSRSGFAEVKRIVNIREIYKAKNRANHTEAICNEVI